MANGKQPAGNGTYKGDPNMNLITQYGRRLLVLGLGAGLVLYYRIGFIVYRIWIPLHVPSTQPAAPHPAGNLCA